MDFIGKFIVVGVEIPINQSILEDAIDDAPEV
jgi:hypothetical protein